MENRVRWYMVGGAIGALVLGYLAVQSGRAADDEPDVKGAVQKIAQSLEKNDNAAASKTAASLPDDLDAGDAMALMSKHNANGKGGLGIGGKAGSGIELMVQKFSKGDINQSQLTQHKADLKRAAYIAAAIAEAVHNRPPVKAPEGKKNPADWKKWSGEMKQQGLDLAKAIDTGDKGQVKQAASNLNDTCVKCHEVFKD
jgi:hypothetical protein